ncbi:molybdopterin-synthase adenylyltransferase MoeB [Flexivirga caeni]|uniref:Molybdopterin-synthase adenylyltransferase MoeB n=1 Tax=Flexivirga caeni TaxID=2294115 RepID=A0A3M9M685_9MICO|nr:molybdopterin-synthase adenylyltransferase MoeB [Flexivirga caeni]RNI21060.1 molybdopterin-synthase adenylyltransferase MoeB [Flexivirga caeni]
MTHGSTLRVGTPDGGSQARRYSRHTLLPEVGSAGQRALADARVVVVGAGGLAAAVLPLLAGAGVGLLTVVDDDVVELSNLHRQVIHRTDDIGIPKVESAVRFVRDLNPEIEVCGIQERLGVGNALPIFAEHDLVVDATDNFAARYLVNDACVLLGLPLVWSSISRFDGQVTVWAYGESPCYRCIFPSAPPAGAVPSCAEGGVIGPLPGVMGAIQATEALKLLLGIGQPLAGRIVVHDALAGTWSEIPVTRDPGCAICGDNPTITTLREEAAMDPAADTDPVPLIAATELAGLISAGDAPLLVDVRGPEERAIVALPGAIPIELAQLRDGSGFDRLAGVDAGTVFYCKGGARSAEAVRLVEAATGVRARSLDGGVLAWIDQVDPSLPRY